MQYKDFNIRINSRLDDGSYDVSVRSPGGDASEQITLPFEIESISGRIQQMSGTVRGEVQRDAEYEHDESISPSEFGAQLYDSLFTGQIGEMYTFSEGAVSQDPDPDMGLRIKLSFDLDDEDVGALAQIPWEFAYRAKKMQFLNLSNKTPIVRYIEVPQPPSVHALKGKLRILVVMSSPSGVAALDLEKERKLIEESWANEENVEVDFLEHPTKITLQDKISDNRYHVLHYMGHGAYDVSTGYGALVLEDENGNQDMLSADDLGPLVRDASRLQLVFLNACNTAKTDEDEPFGSVANRLVMAGVPAVLAMQFPISDVAAINFARAFYKRIVAGHPVDEATAQGRKAIHTGQAGTMEWGTPVLYMRAPDGRLFTAPEPSPVPIPDPVPPPPPSFKKLLAAVAAGAVLGVGGLLYWALTQSLDQWAYENDSLAVNIGDRTELNFTSDRDNITMDAFDGITIRPAAVEGQSAGISIMGTPGIVRIPNSETGADRIALQASVAGLDEGTFSVETIVPTEEETTPRPYLAQVIVGVDPAVAADYQTAIDRATDVNASTESVIQAISTVERRRASSAMNTRLSSLLPELTGLQEARIDAEVSFRANDFETRNIATPYAEQIGLRQKLALYDTWLASFKDVRGGDASESAAPDISAAVQNHQQLAERTIVTRFAICSTAASYNSECGGRLGPYQPDRIYVRAEFARGQQGEEVNVRAYQDENMFFERAYDNAIRNTGDYTWDVWIGAGQLDQSGPIEVRLYNGGGDWIATDTFTL